jgi:ABC-2 type transport system permease protein
VLAGALTIAARDLKARLRDRTALIVAFVAPLGLATILSFALAGPGEFTTLVGLVDDDGGPAAAAFADDVLGAPALEGAVEVRRLDDEAGLRAALDAEEVRAGFVLPAGFSEQVGRGEPAALTVLRSPAAELSGDFAEALGEAFVSRMVVLRRTLSVVEASGAEADLDRVAADVLAGQPALTLGSVDVEAATLAAASYFGPSMAVFFVFFVVSLGPNSIMRERRQATLARLHAAPIPSGAILAGKALGVFVLALASMGVMWAVTTLALGASWGDPAGVVLVSVAVVLAAAGITALIATIARTDDQVDGWTSIVVFTFALLGGNFAPADGLPGPLQTLALATPNGWALRGYTDLAAGAAVGEVLVPVLAILAFAAVTIALTGLRAQRLVAP